MTDSEPKTRAAAQNLPTETAANFSPAKFNTLEAAATQNLLTEIASDLAPVKLPPDKTTVQVADLPFYDEFKFYALSDTTLPKPNTRFMLYKPGDVSLMNWTNEPIYSVNERAPIK